MDRADVQWLASDAGREVLQALPEYRPESAMAWSGRLRSAGLTPSQAAAVLTQSRLRSAVQVRWGQPWHDLVDQLLLTSDGAEQATRPVVAELRAARYAALGAGASVADLGCGVGIDALALAGRGLEVTAYEIDPVTAAVATANASLASPSPPRIVEGDVLGWPVDRWQRYDAVYADPARRRAGRRVSDPTKWSPPLSWVLDLPVDDVGVKVAPGLDRSMVPSDTEFAVVSVGGVVVEAGLYRGRLRADSVSRSATVLPAATSQGSSPRPAAVTLTDLDLPTEPAAVRAIGHFLHEPDGAVIRAGLVTALATQIGAWQVDPQIAYLSTDRQVSSPMVSSYEVTAVLPFSLKALRAHLRSHDVGQVVVKKRGSAVDVDELRRSLRLDRSASGRRVIVLTRIGTSPVAVVSVPVERATAVPSGAGAGSADRLEGGDEIPVVDEG